MSYVRNYEELIEVANQEFFEDLEIDSADDFYNALKYKPYTKWLGRYYRNKILTDVYSRDILIIPKHGYGIERIVYLNDSLTGGTKVGVQAINVTRQDGKLTLRNSGAITLTSLRIFFNSLCNAFGISVDYSEINVYEFCNHVLSSGKFEFVYNRDNDLYIEINEGNFDRVYVVTVVNDGKTYFDEELVQAFANAMYDAGWFTTELDISTTLPVEAGTYTLNVQELTYNMALYYYKWYKYITVEAGKLAGRIDSMQDDNFLILSAINEFKTRYPEKTIVKIFFSARKQSAGSTESFLESVQIMGVDLDTLPETALFDKTAYNYIDDNKAWKVSTYQILPVTIVSAKRTYLGDLSSNVIYSETSRSENIVSPYQVSGISEQGITSASNFLGGSSINITTTEIVKKGVTIIDNAKLPTGLNSLASDYPNWFSYQLSVGTSLVEKISEVLRNVLGIVDYVPLTLITPQLTRPSQVESQSGTVLLPDIVGQLPEITVKYLTPLPTVDEPIPPEIPYIPPEDFTPTPENPYYPNFPTYPYPDNPDSPITNPSYPPSNPPAIGGMTPTIPDNPIVSASNGLFTVYNPTMEQLNEFGGYLWGENIVSILQSIFQNPIDGVISLHVIYATPETGDEVPIKVGYLTSSVSAKKVVEQYINIDCGTVDVPEYYGNVLDYAPYTKAHIYLPFIGIREINVNEIMGSQVNVNYKIDVLTGSVYASISVFHNAISQVLYVFEGNGGVQLPLTGGNMSRILSGVISGIAFGAIGGGAIGAVAGATGGLLKGASVSKSGSVGANAGAMGIKKPYIIITYSQAYMANNYNQQYGYPSNLTTQLSACKGYTRVKEVHVENILVATQEEKDMIQTLLRQGVIIE